VNDFSKYIESGMPLMYEISPSGNGECRWEWNRRIGWIDHGYTDEYAAGWVEGIFTQTTSTHINTAAYVRLKNSQLYTIPFPDHAWYDPKMWSLPGFFYPVGGWGSFLTRTKKVICTCGAAGWAKATNQPCPGHGPLCEITRMGLK
jgi:hypothetical protein